ncbi:unnamed protein product [Sphagnum balticum]
MPFGELEVYVEGALGIKNTSVFGNSSPYCVLTCGTQQSKTPIAQDGGSNPYWNTTVKFKIDRSCQELGVKIFSHNILTADDEIAYTSLSFKKVFYAGHVVPIQAFTVIRPSGRVGGQIRMALVFFSNALKRQQTQEPNPDPNYQQTSPGQIPSYLRSHSRQGPSARAEYGSDSFKSIDSHESIPQQEYTNSHTSVAGRSSDGEQYASPCSRSSTPHLSDEFYDPHESLPPVCYHPDRQQHINFQDAPGPNPAQKSASLNVQTKVKTRNSKKSRVQQDRQKI